MRYGTLDEIVQTAIDNMHDVLKDEGQEPTPENIEPFIDDFGQMVADAARQEFREKVTT